MISTPLQYIKQLAAEFDALAIALVVYEPTSPGDDDEYTETPRPIFYPLDKVDGAFAKLSETPGMEVGLASQFLTADARLHHFVFGDVDNDEKCPGRCADIASFGSRTIPVVSSPGRWHFYTDEREDDFQRLQARLLMTEGIDVMWIAAGLTNGFNILRLTGNSARFTHTPHLEAPINPKKENTHA